MDVFVSWAGKRSQALAEALKDWLPLVINAVHPWLSSANIESGARWSTEIAQMLEKVEFGILCLTPKSLHSEWVLFEAGALSKTITRTHVCPLLVDLSNSDVTGPLSQFQSETADFSGIRKLLLTINGALGQTGIQESQLLVALDVFWPMLQKKLDDLPPEDNEPLRTKRDVRDIAEETLNLLRGMVNRQQEEADQLRASIDRQIIAENLRQYENVSDRLAEMTLKSKLEVGKKLFQSFSGLELLDLKKSGPDLYTVTANYQDKTVAFAVKVREPGVESFSRALSRKLQEVVSSLEARS